MFIYKENTLEIGPILSRAIMVIGRLKAHLSHQRINIRVHRTIQINKETIIVEIRVKNSAH